MPRSKPRPRRPRPPRQKKERGEWVEMKFVVEAVSHGLIVSKPYGDSCRFDFVVIAGNRLFRRVQVKSASRRYGDTYRIACCTGRRRRRYTPSQIDFFALYIIDQDAWYIVPAPAIGHGFCIWVNPQVRNSRARFEPYRDAWHLLFE